MGKTGMAPAVSPDELMLARSTQEVGGPGRLANEKVRAWEQQIGCQATLPLLEPGQARGALADAVRSTTNGQSRAKPPTPPGQYTLRTRLPSRRGTGPGSELLHYELEIRCVNWADEHGLSGGQYGHLSALGLMGTVTWSSEDHAAVCSSPANAHSGTLPTG